MGLIKTTADGVTVSTGVLSITGTSGVLAKTATMLVFAIHIWQ